MKPENLQPKKRREGQGLSTRARLAIAGGAAIAAIALGGGIAYKANEESIRQVIDRIIPGLGETESIEKKFPIIPSFTSVTPEEEKKLWENTQTLDLKNHTVTTGFPFGQETIDRNPGLRMDQQFEGYLLPPFIDGAKLKQEGVKNVTYYSGLQKGEDYRFFYPDNFEASVIFMYKAGVERGVAGNSYIPAYAVYRVTLRDKKTGEIIKKNIAGLWADPLIETKSFPTDHHQIYEDGTPVKSGVALLRTTTDLQDWDGKTGQILPGQKGQFVEGTSFEQQDPMAPIPLTTKFPRASDGDIAISSK